MSRGIANCNPGNIRQARVRYRGEKSPSRDPQFKQFQSMAWGYRAIFVLLDTYARKYGLRTIRGMITRWAPPCENHTEHYIACVAQRSAFAPDAELDTRKSEQMIPIAAAISWVENGVEPDWTEIEAG